MASLIMSHSRVPMTIIKHWKGPKWKLRWTPIPKTAHGPWEKWELGGRMGFVMDVLWISFAVGSFTGYDMDEGPIHFELVEMLVF